MRNIFSSFRAKLYHWYNFSKFCFGEKGHQIRESREISKLSLELFNCMKYSERDDLDLEDFESFFGLIYGIYISTIGHHDAIQTLALSGHSLNSMINLRPHLESVLTLLYILEPDDNLNEVYSRVDLYQDWVMIKMKKNMDRSKDLPMSEIVMPDNFRKTIKENYDMVKEKHRNNPELFSYLKKANSFLNGDRRLAIAEKFRIDAYYKHIYAEASASIHITDISDRMNTWESIYGMGFEYKIRRKDGTFWPLLMANILQINSIKGLANFFKIYHLLEPKIKKVFQ